MKTQGPRNHGSCSPMGMDTFEGDDVGISPCAVEQSRPLTQSSITFKFPPWKTRPYEATTCPFVEILRSLVISCKKQVRNRGVWLQTSDSGMTLNEIASVSHTVQRSVLNWDCYSTGQLDLTSEYAMLFSRVVWWSVSDGWFVVFREWVEHGAIIFRLIIAAVIVVRSSHCLVIHIYA